MTRAAKRHRKPSPVELPLARGRWAAVCLGTMAALLLFPAAARELGYRVFTWQLFIEDSLYEVAGALCALLAGILFFAAYVSGKAGNDFGWFKTPRNVFFAVLGILMLFLFGEEISWGQRLFGYATPAWMSGLNTQGEFTLHNLDFFEPNAITNYFSVLSMFALVPYFGVLPFLYSRSQRLRSLLDRVGLPVPSGVLAATFWLGLAGQVWIFFSYSDGEFFVQELNDAVTEVAFLLLALEAYARHVVHSKMTTWRKVAFATGGVLLVVLPLAALVQARTSGPPVETLIADYLCSKGEFTLNAGLTDQAIELLDESLEFAPHNARATCVLGRAYHQKGNLDRAVDRYNAVLKMNPDDVIAHFYRGLVFHDRGQFDQAIADFRQALTKDPQFQPAREALEMTIRQKHAGG